MNHFVKRRLITVFSTLGIISASTQVLASGFQLWEQDGASVGNYHAGYAAEASNASTAFYNPAGLTRIKNQQLVVGASGIRTHIKYVGDVGVTERSVTLAGIRPVTVNFTSVTAPAGTFSVVPNLQYAAPIGEQYAFGFSVDAPFGLKTNYGRTTPVRYAATLSSITVVDISPSLAMKVTDKISGGIGLNIQRSYAELNSVAGLISPNPFSSPRFINTSFDTLSKNKANGTGYGFTLGLLYEFTPCTRAGISYHSQVVHHLSGSSKFTGNIANVLNGGPIVSSRAIANVKLPPYTALSIFNQFSPQWAVMGSVIYTQWNTFRNLSLDNIAGAVDAVPLAAPSTNINVNIPERYRNTYNISLGGNYYYSDCIILRTGLGYDRSPVSDVYRNVQLPDNNRYSLGLGAHYQATKNIGFDASWLHVFFAGDATVNPPPQVTGAATVSTNGYANGSADVISGQVVWDIA